MALTLHSSFKKLTVTGLHASSESPTADVGSVRGTRDKTEAFACPICNQVKSGAMVEHLVCRRLFCCACIGRLLDDGSKCAART